MRIGFLERFLDRARIIWGQIRLNIDVLNSLFALFISLPLDWLLDHLLYWLFVRLLFYLHVCPTETDLFIGRLNFAYVHLCRMCVLSTPYHSNNVITLLTFWTKKKKIDRTRKEMNTQSNERKKSNIRVFSVG